MPSSDEWVELINAVGGVYDAGKSLKSNVDWNGFKDRQLGFSVLPGGEYFTEGGNPKYDYILENAAFWTSSAKDKYLAYAVTFDDDRVYVDGYYFKDDRFSVRCIMDE